MALITNGAANSSDSNGYNELALCALSIACFFSALIVFVYR